MSNKLKKIGIKNLTYYFFDSMINIKKYQDRWKVIQKYSYLINWLCGGQRL